MVPLITGDQLWDVVPATIGAVVGAAAATLPAFWLARTSSRELLKRDKEQRLAENKSRAFRLMTVYIAVSNSLFTLYGMLQEMLQRPVSENEKTPNQRRVSALIGFSFEAAEHFSADDLAIIAASNDGALVTDLMQLAEQHAAIISSFADYKLLKLKNHELLSDGSEHRIDGEVVSTVIKDPALAARIQLNDAQLESIIVQLIEMVHDGAFASIDIGRRFNNIMVGLLPDGSRPHVDVNAALIRFPELENARTN